MHRIPENAKVSKFDSLKQVEKTTGRVPIELENEPELPKICYPVWGIFTRLGDSSLSEYRAYTEMTGSTLAPWETDTILALCNLVRES